MSRIYVANHVSLDGVIQAPGRADEDTRDAFSRGGWASAGMNDAVAAALQERVTQAGGMRLLLGHRSYDDMLGYWNTQDSPFKHGLNAAQKYVVSRSAATELPWPNSTLVTGDVVDEIRALRREAGVDLCVMGSGELVRTLLDHGLVDELLLFIHPLLLGKGGGMFPEGGIPGRLEQIRCDATSTGILIAHYRLDNQPAGVTTD
jgi:dihydrofolate reductase